MSGARLSNSSNRRLSGGKVRQGVGRNAGLEPFGEGRFQHQRGDDGGEVGVAAALADAVQRALYLARARVDGGQRIGHRLPRIVMGVDAEMVAGHGFLDHRFHDGADVDGLGAAIRVAQHDPLAHRLERRTGAGERIIAVGLEAVEEVLAIDQRFLARGFCSLDGLADGVEVFLIRAAERHPHMQIPRLGDEADGGGGRLRERGEAGVVRRRHARALGHAEGGEGGRLVRGFSKNAVSVGFAPG